MNLDVYILGVMEMSKQKEKGTRMETGLVRYLRARLSGDTSELIHRAALTGNADQGDVHGLRYNDGNRVLQGIAEVKNHKQVSPSLVAKWRQETVAERENADADFAVLVIHRNGCDQTGNAESYGRNAAQMTVSDMLLLLGIDQSATPRDDLMSDWVETDVDGLVRLLSV